VKKYPFAEIEKKWQTYWEENNSFRVTEDPSFPPDKRVYVLDMFPYPSGSGLHVGHPEGYTATDIYSRYLRMTGHNVLHPMGFDSFGLAAETYAIQTGTHPGRLRKIISKPSDGSSSSSGSAMTGAGRSPPTPKNTTSGRSGFSSSSTSGAWRMWTKFPCGTAKSSGRFSQTKKS
jgi:hypothetical protein